MMSDGHPKKRTLLAEHRSHLLVGMTGGWLFTYLLTGDLVYAFGACILGAIGYLFIVSAIRQCEAECEHE